MDRKALLAWLEDRKTYVAYTQATQIFQDNMFDDLLLLSKDDWRGLFPSEALFGTFIFNNLHPSQVTRLFIDPHLVSPNEFLSTKPPLIQFSDNLMDIRTKSSEPRFHTEDPRYVGEWLDFTPAASNFKFNEEIDKIRLKSSAFIRYVSSVSNRSVLNGRIDTNILNNCNYLMNKVGIPYIFSSPTDVKDALKGRMTFALHKDGELRSVVETKTFYELNTPIGNESLAKWWIEDQESELSSQVHDNVRPSVYHTVAQVYGYLANHGLKYGLLTNGIAFWVLCRPDPEKMPCTLLISPAILLGDESPHLFQALFYYISLVEEGHTSSISPNLNINRRLNNETISTSINTHLNKQLLNHPDLPVNFNMGAVTEIIGSGVCGNVFRFKLNGIDLALKCCDRMNNKPGFAMMKNEIQIYEKLLCIQDHRIPKLHWFGFIGELYVIATSFIDGSPPEYLTKGILKEFQSLLADNQVEHGDLRPENVIIDKANKVWLIDFGMSSIKAVKQ